MQDIALVGFSVNTELILTYDRMTEQEKGRLLKTVPDLCGTSANVARAIMKLGGKSRLLALTGVNEDFESHILRFSLKKYEVPFEEFRILDKSHFAILPLDNLPNQKIFGDKGNIVEEKLPDVLNIIEKQEGKWRICTGIRPAELPLAEALFNSCFGYRSLNPPLQLIQEKVSFLKILQKCDLLIMNDKEYEACRVASMEELHDLGPRLVIVTENQYGGRFSLRGNKPERFDPCSEYLNGQKPHSVGSGDWFHSAFIARISELGHSIDSMDDLSLIDAISFATRVSGKKVTMPGAANGPSQHDL